MLRVGLVASVLLPFLGVLANGQTPCATIAACRAENEQLRANLAVVTKEYDAFKTDALKLLDYAKTLKAAYQQAVDDNDKLANKYNYLLAEAKQQLRDADEKLERVNRDLNHSNQRANFLAMYSLMPKYQPPPTINLNVTDCTRFPALCIH
jgi:hypothetical protein